MHPKEGLGSSPDLTGDLVFSEKAGFYGAMFVVRSEFFPLAFSLLLILMVLGESANLS